MAGSGSHIPYARYQILELLIITTVSCGLVGSGPKIPITIIQALLNIIIVLCGLVGSVPKIPITK